MNRVVRRFFKLGSFVLGLFAAFVALNTTFLVPGGWFPLRIGILVVAGTVCYCSFYASSGFD
jgi:hypothetical protein